jgi:hypothetical protein
VRSNSFIPHWFRAGIFALITSSIGSIACRDWAGPIPDTEQATESSDPAPPAPSEGAPTASEMPPADSNGGSSEQPAEGGAGEELVSFDRDVHPILVAKCGMCHEGAAPALPDHGAADVEVSFAATQGMSADEPVYLRILARASGDGGFMPPEYAGCEGPLGSAGCLTVEEYDLIELWVEQGASNR